MAWASMMHHLARQMKQTPTYGRHRVVTLGGVQSGMPEQEKRIVRNDAGTEEGGIGFGQAGEISIAEFWR